MAYKNNKEYREDKRRWNNSAWQARAGGGYQRFKIREAAWLQLQAIKDNDDDDKGKGRDDKDDKDYDRGSGKFDDIKAALKDDADKGRDAADKFKNKGVSSGKDSKEYKKLEKILEKQQKAWNKKQGKLDKQLSDLAISLESKTSRVDKFKGQLAKQKTNSKEKRNNLKTNLNNRYKDQTANLRKDLTNDLTKSLTTDLTAKSNATLAEQLGLLTSSYDAKVAGLESSLGDYGIQVEDLTTSLSDTQAQLLSSQAQVQTAQQQAQTAEAARVLAETRADNMRSAFVPQANPTATSATYGDQREAVTTTRRAKDNRLSDLTILSGLGTESNPLAGLQLA